LVNTNPRAFAFMEQAAHPSTLRIETTLSAAIASLSHRGPDATSAPLKAFEEA